MLKSYDFCSEKTGDAPPEGAIGVSNRAAALSKFGVEALRQSG